ncbi:MAG: Xaa-Pro peptidase family protein [Thermoprotei archaeon]
MRDNIKKLYGLIESKNLNAIIISSPDSIEYFLGVESIGDARLVFYADKSGSMELYVPVLEYYRYKDQLEQRGIVVYGVSRRIKPRGMKLVELEWENIITKLIERHSERIGVDKKHSPLLEKILIEKRLDSKVVDVSDSITELRTIKDDWEIESIQKAIEITGRGIYEMVNSLSENITETELAGVFEYTVRKEGVTSYAFPPLVLFKPGNSYPHNYPSSTRLGRDNIVLMDVGVRVNNRCSDITRVAIWGSISEEEKKVLEVVLEALDNAIDTVEPGIKAGDIDKSARSIIERNGYGDYFIHGLGHGIGVVVHESPYIRAQADTVIKPNMVFTIEPGIYIPGKYGIRIEENVLVTKKGAKVLSERIDRVFF